MHILTLPTSLDLGCGLKASPDQILSMILRPDKASAFYLHGPDAGCPFKMASLQSRHYFSAYPLFRLTLCQRLAAQLVLLLMRRPVGFLAGAFFLLAPHRVLQLTR